MFPTSRKIYDILPPSEDKPSQILSRKTWEGKPVSKQEYFAKEPEEELEEEKEPERKPEEKRKAAKEERKTGRPKRRLFSLKKSITLLLLVLIVVVIVGYFVLGNVLAKTEIKIWPQSQVQSFKEKITADVKLQQADFGAKTIPGKIFQTEKTGSQQFQSTGKTLKEGKAKGIIRVYNGYSVSPQILVANTRFISAEGKLFRSAKRETIPGGTTEKGRLTPGYIDIEVLAAEAGPRYNIGPSTFSIPGFLGTTKYTTFYGRSSSAMSGGFSGQVPQVTQEDLDRAKNGLAEKLYEESRLYLQDTATKQGFILFDKSRTKELIEAKPKAKAGDKVESFVYEAKVASKLFGVKKTDLENFAKDFVSSQLARDKKLKEWSLNINPTAELVDLVIGKAVINLGFGATVSANIDLAAINKTLRGKSTKEAQMLLKNSPQISKVQLKIWPFWANTIPQKENRIKIELNFD